MTEYHEIEVGQTWTFVHPEGKRVDYVIDDIDNVVQVLARIVTIRNAKTGGLGYVTLHWMRRAQGWRDGWFEFKAEPVAVAA